MIYPGYFVVSTARARARARVRARCDEISLGYIVASLFGAA